jgi:hypothetical protein
VYKWFIIAILFLSLNKLHGTEINITGKEACFYVTPEFNRAFLFCWDIAAVGNVTLNERYTIKSGFALGTVGINFDIKGFAGGEAAPFAAVPVSFGLDYQYNGVPEFENHIHSLKLLVSYKRKWAGVSVGHNFRFTSFFGETAVFEPNYACSVYVFFINNELFRLGLKAANFDEFTVGNIGAYFLNLNSMVRLNEKTSIINEIETRQSGSVALASNFYGIVYRGGVLFSW